MNDKNESLKEYTKLSKQKLEIEHEIAKLQRSIAGTFGVPLVDSNGFPSSEIDVPLVAATRQRINMLNNDHVKVMNSLESIMEKVYRNDTNDNFEKSESSTCGIEFSPIAFVGNVCPDSPADKCGLKVQDKIIHFGPINSHTISSLEDIQLETRCHEEQSILVHVLRDDSLKIRLVLEPRKWSGPGLLGCQLLPIS